MAVKIRPAVKEDWPAIVALVRQAVAELEGRFGIPDVSEVMSPLIAQGIELGEAVYVADVDGAVVGYVAWVGHVPGIPKGRAIGLGTYVDPQHRRRHLSDELRAAASARCRELGYVAVRGEAHVDNEAGLRSCERLGFKPVAVVVELDL